MLGSDENIVSLNVSNTIMETKRSTLGLYKNSVLEKQFDDPLWEQQKNTASSEEWNWEEVAKWVATIKGMPDDVDPAYVRNDVNVSAFIFMGRE